MKNEIKLIKTDSGTDWEAYQVVRTDTARWVEDDMIKDIMDEHRMDRDNFAWINGYNKAIEEFEKIIDLEKEEEHNKDCIICWNLIEGFKKELKKMKMKK